MDMQINVEQAANNFQQLQPEEKEAFGQVVNSNIGNITAKIFGPEFVQVVQSFVPSPVETQPPQQQQPEVQQPQQEQPMPTPEGLGMRPQR
tara:strand:- start:22 stop:294 length:273 start_codon:yes stop_codon:yes gene_type:complete